MFSQFPTYPTKNNDNVLQSMPLARFKESGTNSKKTNFIKEHTLIFVLQGKKIVHFDDYSYTAQSSHMIFLKRGIYTVSEYVPNDVLYESLMVFFTDHFIKKFLHSYHFTKIESQSNANYLVIPSSKLLDSLKIQLLEYSGKSIKRIDALLQLKLQELLLLLLEGSNERQILSFLQNIVFETPLDIDYVVNKYLFHPLSVEDFAKLSNRSLAAFKRDFQKKYILPPKKWINRQRLIHAKVLLQNTSKRVSEIAMECGYENTSHFIRIYKNEYRSTPNQDRSKKAIF